jgi:hypothetical protein
VAIAASVIEMARAGRFAGLEELFAPPLRAVVSAATIQTAWTAEATRIGPVKAVGTPVSEPAVSGLVRVSTPVTVGGDLARWRAGLAGRPDVTIRIYDADDHMFFAGAGKSAPADYERPRHVDAAVVADIAGWLVPGAARGRSHGSSPVCGGRLR